VTVLLHNGTRRTVRGPYRMDPCWRDYKKLVQHLGRPELNKRLTKFKIGRIAHDDRGYHIMKDSDIIFAETRWSVEPILPRLLHRWDNLDIEVLIRNGLIYKTSVASLKKRGGEPGN
jgi:hypothetical protein